MVLDAAVVEAGVKLAVEVEVLEMGVNRLLAEYRELKVEVDGVKIVVDEGVNDEMEDGLENLYLEKEVV